MNEVRREIESVEGAINPERIKDFWRGFKEENLGIIVHGGNTAAFRTSRNLSAGIDHDRLDNLLSSASGLDRSGKVSSGFMAGSNDQKFLMFRFLNPSGNRTYSSTFCLDFKEEGWQAVGYNTALVAQHILENQELWEKLRNNPESIRAEEFRVLAEDDWSQVESPDPSLQQTVNKAISSETPTQLPGGVSTPSIREFAGALQQVPLELRKDFTWILGDDNGFQRQFGAKLGFKST